MSVELACKNDMSSSYVSTLISMDFGLEKVALPDYHKQAYISPYWNV